VNFALKEIITAKQRGDFAMLCPLFAFLLRNLTIAALFLFRNFTIAVLLFSCFRFFLVFW